MSIQNDIAREDIVHQTCQKIARLIEKNRTNMDTVNALKELGREILRDFLPNTPGWTQNFKSFRE